MAYITAKWDLVTIMWGTFLPTVKRGNRRIKVRVNGTDIFVIEIGGRTQDAVFHKRIISRILLCILDRLTIIVIEFIFIIVSPTMEEP